jgi:hypothetical protein
VPRRLEETWKPWCFPQTVVPAEDGVDPRELWEPPAGQRQPGRPARPRSGSGDRPGTRSGPLPSPEALPASTARSLKLKALVAEWLLELKVIGRSPRTIAWYEQKMSWYLDHEGGPATLDLLTAFELKRLLASLQEVLGLDDHPPRDVVQRQRLPQRADVARDLVRRAWRR